MNTYEYTKYICNTTDEINQSLDNYGVAIVPSVLDETECLNLFNSIFDDLVYLTKNTEYPIIKENTETWKNYRKLFPLRSMLIQHWKIGHLQSVWDVRQNPKIVDIFSNIYSQPRDKLLVSFDGVSFQFPPEAVYYGWNRNNTWFHTDQSYTRTDKECIQSWITAKDVNIGDSTIAFLEGSHKYHQSFAETFRVTDKKDWYKLNAIQESFYKDTHNCAEKRIYCPKGSLVLWDSRTIHCGSEPYRHRTAENFRCIVYLCYQPISQITPKNLEKKRKAFNEMRMTTHYPCKVKLFGKNPQTYGEKLPSNINEIQPPILSELGRKLAGFDI
jgi:ectoine hydroxylase-related dioxygenase (phytanoyl-CoA dioxygenase family)